MGTNFSVLITTYNRLEELKYTLNSLKILCRAGAKVIICDDASTDGTSEFIRKEYPKIQLLVNSENRGLIYSRNLLMNQVKTPYAVSLDDDANFLRANILQEILSYFNKEIRCGVIAFRIFWGVDKPESLESDEKPEIVKSFVGCGHAWRMEAWKEIPEYPSWYEFYGEENYASFQLLKHNWEVHFVPTILVHHRVDNKARKNDKDFYTRARKSLRADWYNYIIFYPGSKLIWVLLYSVKMQVIKAYDQRRWIFIKIIFSNINDLIRHIRLLINYRNKLTKYELIKWQDLKETQIYWYPDSSKRNIQHA